MNALELTAEKALERIHNSYGEVVRLLKYVPNATASIYRQRKKVYESPYEVVGCVARTPLEELRTRTGEGSSREAKITIPVSFLSKIFGNSTPIEKTITTSDMIIFDERVWRITLVSMTSRLAHRPLLFSLELREKLGEKEEVYL